MRNTAHTISHKLNEMKHSKRNGKRVSKNEESEVSVEFNQRNTEQWNWEYDSIDYSQTRVVQALVFVKRWFDSTGEDSLRAYAYTRLFEYRHANTYTQTHNLSVDIHKAQSLSFILSFSLLHCCCLCVRLHTANSTVFSILSFSLSLSLFKRISKPKIHNKKKNMKHQQQQQ